jgi:hypothetical protein
MTFFHSLSHHKLDFIREVFRAALKKERNKKNIPNFLIIFK